MNMRHIGENISVVEDRNSRRNSPKCQFSPHT